LVVGRAGGEDRSTGAGSPIRINALDVGFVEALHLVVQTGGEADHGDGERGAARLAEPQPEVEQRLESELGESLLVRWLG
jgi:hypothetical protein